MRLITRADILTLLGATSLILVLLLPEDMIKYPENLLTYSIIFFTGAIIVGAVENKK